ncbi:hypothetical protein ACVGOW_27355 [Pseudonocardia saturnea]
MRIFRLAHTDPDLVRVAQAARDGFERWSTADAQPMLVGSGCVITGTDMADRAAAMAAVGADCELIGSGSDRLRIPVVDVPAVALLDVGGGVVEVDAVREYLTAKAGRGVVHEPVFAIRISAVGAAVVTSAGGVAVSATAGHRVRLMAAHPISRSARTGRNGADQRCDARGTALV